MLQYVTENRLHAVISKIGKITDKDFSKLLGLFAQDAIIDYHKERKTDICDELSNSTIKRINKLINTASASLIRENFVNIIDGTF